MVTEFDGMYSRLDSSRIGRTDRLINSIGLVLRMLTRGKKKHRMRCTESHCSNVL